MPLNWVFKSFASDNNSGVDSRILSSIEKINKWHVLSYWNDIYTQQTKEIFKSYFGDEIDTYFVFSWTSANVLILNYLLDKNSAVLCSNTAHINVHEEISHKKLTWYKYILIPTTDWKIELEDLKNSYIQNKLLNPKVISITNPTEYWIVYSIDEIKSICDFAHQNNMLVHMDGARISNAAVSLWLDLKQISFDAWVDVLFFWWIKNWLMFWESIIFKDKLLWENFWETYEALLQCWSKMRFLSVQFYTYLNNKIRYENANHSNKMAKLLESELIKIPQIKITQKVQTNWVWCIFPSEIIPLLQQKFPFYIWNENTSEIRLMCSFDTSENDIKKFIDYLKELIV